MNGTTWIKDIKPEDLPAQYAEMVEIIGVDATLKLAEHYKKTPFYFVGLEKLIEKKKKEYIFANFTGDNHCRLARETNYSSRHVYNILKAHHETRHSQFGLFDK